MSKNKKRWLFIALATLPWVALIAVIFSGKIGQKKCCPSEVISSDDEGLVNPSNRKQWELDRLRDPKTGKLPPNILNLERRFVSNMPGSIEFIKSNKLPTSLKSADWKNRGPYKIGGRTRSIIFDVKNPNRLVAGGVSSGVWITEDDGKNWTKTTAPNQLNSVVSIVQDTRTGKENNWYYTTGELIGGWPDRIGGAFYHSTNNGMSWNSKIAQNNNPATWDDRLDFTYKLVLNHKAPIDRDELYVASALAGISRTTDGGNTWSSVIGNFSNSMSLYSDIEIAKETGVFYATLSAQGTGGNMSPIRGIYRSENGSDWTRITPPGYDSLYNKITIGIAPSNENIVYFLSNNLNSGKATRNSQLDTVWHGLWKYEYISGDGSGDGGKWTNLSENLPVFPHRYHSYNSQGSYNMDVFVHPDDINMVFLHGTNLYRSTDGFTSSSNTDVVGGYSMDIDNITIDTYMYPNHHPDLHYMIFHPENSDIVYTASDGGVHKTLSISKKEVEWISLNNGYLTTQFYSVAVDKGTEGSVDVMGGMQDNESWISFSEESDADWKFVLGFDGFNCQIANGGDFIIASQNGRIPGIRLWKIILDEDGKIAARRRFDPIGGRDFIWNTPFVLDPNDNNKLYIAGGRMVWRQNDLREIPLDDGRDTISIGWDSLSFTALDRIENPIAAERVSAISVSKNPANVLYYGTNRGKIYRIDEAHLGDPIPVNITDARMPNNANVGCISINPENADDIIAVFTNYNVTNLFHSTDGGTNWKVIRGNLGGYGAPAIFWVEPVKVGDTYLYLAGTSAGLFSTAYLNGESTVWQQEAAELIGTAPINQIASRQSDGFVALATYSIGVFTGYVTSLPEKANKISLISPANDSKGMERVVDFNWLADSKSHFYQIEVSSDPDFNSVFFTQDKISNNEIRISNFANGPIKYYWRVRGLSAGGAGEWSDVYSFETLLRAPELIFPIANAVIDSSFIEFEWEKMPLADSYRLQISTSFLAQPFFDSLVGESNLFYSKLTPNSNFVWRVAAIDSYGQSEFSSFWRFSTGDFLSTRIASYITPQHIIAPNPSNGIFSLKSMWTDLPISSIKIYDLNGNNLLNLEDYLPNSKIDASEFPAGVYYLELNTISGISVLKLNIQK